MYYYKSVVCVAYVLHATILLQHKRGNNIYYINNE